MDADVVVIGAGAAGMMCAAEAASRGRRVTLLDHRATIGERIRISGGGRCNVTNLRVSADNYLSQNPHFCRSALARFTPTHMLALLERDGIAWEERELGQVFCRRSAADVVAMLVGACRDAGVRLVAPCEVASVRRPGDTAQARSVFHLDTSAGPMTCASLVVATGGLAVPRLGASPFGYRLAEQFGIPVVEPRPGLVPLTLPDDQFAWLRPLTGVAFEARVSCADTGAAFQGSALVTHRGLSGPAILQLSSYWQYGADSAGARPIAVNLLPGTDVLPWLDAVRRDGRALASALAEVLPRRLADALLRQHGWPATLAECPAAVQRTIAGALSNWTLTPSGTLGFAKAEVTLGGIDTRALSSQTMEARSVPGLYFVGEVVDVTGWLGGYNFQWAWSSGWVAGQYA